MKSKTKYKGRLRSYMWWPLYLIIIFLCVDIPVCVYEQKAGMIMIGFTAFYSVLVTVLYNNSKSVISREIINFATKYASVQKKLLDEFEIPYVLTDHSGRILWMNEHFCMLTNVDKKYSKSIASLFSPITREFLQKNERPQELQLEREGRLFRVSINRIYFDEIAEQSEMLDMDT